MTSMEDKKLILGLELFLIIIVAVCLISVSCGNNITHTYQDATEQAESEYEKTICGGYFVVITSWGPDGINDSYYIVYAQDTNVKYFITRTGYWFGITPLYNADGTLQIYGEADNQSQQ